jgi:hypothetical protein
MKLDSQDLMSVSEANALGVAGLIEAAETHGRKVLVRDNKAVAAVIPIGRLEELEAIEDAEDDLLDLALALARQLTTPGPRTSLDDVLREFGYSREELRELDA